MLLLYFAIKILWHAFFAFDEKYIMANRENPSSRENEQGRNKKNVNLDSQKNQDNKRAGDKKDG